MEWIHIFYKLLFHLQTFHKTWKITMLEGSMIILWR